MVGRGPGAGQSGVARRARGAAWRPCGAGRQEGLEMSGVPCELVGEQRWAGPRRSEILVKAGARMRGIGVAAGARVGPASMRAGDDVAGPECAGCDWA